MGEISDIAGKFLDDRLPRAMEALGIKAAAMVSTSIDEPYPPASSQGNPPHRRTGNLRAGVDHIDGPDSTTIKSSRAEGNPLVPKFLEFGTSRMAARPYMRPVQNQGDALVSETMKRAFASGVPIYASGD